MIEFRTVSDDDLVRATLFNRTRLNEETGCWEWQAGLASGGYGLFCYRNQNQRAHRVSYQVWVGPIPEGMVVRHGCDNPRCVNPNHLSVGTMKDNMADREARGRRDVRGEQIGTAKLTEGDVLEIRASSLSLRALSEKYGIDKSNVWLVRSGRSWKHVNAEMAL